MARDEFGKLLDQADRNNERNIQRHGPASFVGDTVVRPVRWVNHGNSLFDRVGRAAVLVGCLGTLGMAGKWAYGYLADEGCDSAYFDDLSSAANGEPCRVPIMASLELLSADQQHVVPDVIALELDTDTRAVGQQGTSYRVLEVDVSGEATANYSQTALAADLPADQVNALAYFGIVNNAITAGGEMGQRAAELCDRTVADMLASVRSNPQWFANDSFPASMIVDPNLVPHASEGGVNNFEIRFVTHDPAPVVGGVSTSAAGSQNLKRSLACAKGPGA